MGVIVEAYFILIFMLNKNFCNNQTLQLKELNQTAFSEVFYSFLANG